MPYYTSNFFSIGSRYLLRDRLGIFAVLLISILSIHELRGASMGDFERNVISNIHQITFKNKESEPFANVVISQRIHRRESYEAPENNNPLDIPQESGPASRIIISDHEGYIVTVNLFYPFADKGIQVPKDLALFVDELKKNDGLKIKNEVIPFESDKFIEAFTQEVKEKLKMNIEFTKIGRRGLIR